MDTAEVSRTSPRQRQMSRSVPATKKAAGYKMTLRFINSESFRFVPSSCEACASQNLNTTVLFLEIRPSCPTGPHVSRLHHFPRHPHPFQPILKSNQSEQTAGRRT